MNNGIAKLIKTDGTMVSIEPADGKAFTLEELQKFVGGYIQIIRPPSRVGALLVVNEEGRLIGLPFNPAASLIYEKDEIVGDAVLCRDDQVA
jgi:hypothetical protein